MCSSDLTIAAAPPASAASVVSPPSRPLLSYPPADGAGEPAPWATFSFFHPELRIQAAVLQPLAWKIQKNCRNFSFVHGLPPIAMDYHGGIWRQSSGKASHPSVFPSPAWGRRLLFRTARLPSPVLPDLQKNSIILKPFHSPSVYSNEQYNNHHRPGPCHTIHQSTNPLIRLAAPAQPPLPEPISPSLHHSITPFRAPFCPAFRK